MVESFISETRFSRKHHTLSADLASEFGAKRFLQKYRLPQGMRYAKLAERKTFYVQEFDTKRVVRWLSKVILRPRLAIVIGRHTGLYPEEYEENASTTILINRYRNFANVRTQILDFLPESVYYDQNVYGANGKILGEEMAFDLDPENLNCPIHGSLEKKMSKGQGLSFCRLELDMLREETIRLYEEIQETFSKISLVYSGRGYHLHVVDRDSFLWTYKARRDFARQLKKQGHPIDDWVTSGRLRMIRLPFTLHGMVSRIVLPLELRELDTFDPIRDKRCIPKFLRSTSSSPS